MSIRAVWIILLKMPTGINYKTIRKLPHSAVKKDLKRLRAYIEALIYLPSRYVKLLLALFLFNN